LHAPRYDIFLGISLSSPWIAVLQQLGTPINFSEMPNSSTTTTAIVTRCLPPPLRRPTRRRSGLGRTLRTALYNPKTPRGAHRPTVLALRHTRKQRSRRERMFLQTSLLNTLNGTMGSRTRDLVMRLETGKIQEQPRFRIRFNSTNY
jgi:hypothetical protein